MRMVAGAILILAAAVCASGYQIAGALHAAWGRPLPFLGWAFGVAGLGLMIADSVQLARGDKEKP